jgi:hypothetical protein
MRVNRRFLNWGVFLVAIGGVLVAADLTAVDRSIVADAMRLWPLGVIAIGVGLILRRTRFALAGGLMAAAVPGLLIGGAFAMAPNLAVDCGGGELGQAVVTRDGVFDGPARVSLSSGCGTLDVDVAPGNGWQFQSGTSTTRAPIIDSSTRSLSIDAGGGNGWRFFDRTHDTWKVTLPTSTIDDLSLVVNAGEGRIHLPGAQIGTLELTTNAAQTSVDLSGASVTRLSGTVNAGLLAFHLPAGSDVSGSMEVNAGALQVCVPIGTGLRVHHTGVLNGITVAGQHQSGSEWQSQDYSSAAHHADLDVNVNLGGLEINPIGGCK